MAKGLQALVAQSIWRGAISWSLGLRGAVPPAEGQRERVFIDPALQGGGLTVPSHWILGSMRENL